VIPRYSIVIWYPDPSVSPASHRLPSWLFWLRRSRNFQFFTFAIFFSVQLLMSVSFFHAGFLVFTIFSVQLLSSVSFFSCGFFIFVGSFLRSRIFFHAAFWRPWVYFCAVFLTYEIFSRIAWCPQFEASFAMCILYCNLHTGTLDLHTLKLELQHWRE